MSREAQTDFLPWILGALVAAIAALAFVIHAAPNRTGLSADALPTKSPETVPLRALQVTVPASAGATPAPAALPVTPLAAPIPPTVVPVPSTDLPPGQVYECLQNGQRTFSDSPCGDRPAIRQLSEVNRMAAVAVAPDVPRARFAQPAPYPGTDTDYGPAGEQSASDATSGGLLLYPAPLVPYRYHRQHELDEHPRAPPHSAPQRPQSRVPAHDLGSSGRG
jgi:hypothetical protein